MTFESSGAGSIGPEGEKKLPTHKLQFETDGMGGLIGLHIVNVILSLLTLLLYRFWAITRVRRALWPRMKFQGSPMEYTGTGLEIFVGFLKVFFLILLPYSIFAQWALDTIFVKWLFFGPAVLNAFEFALLIFGAFVPVLFIYSAGSFLAFRYRVNRTQWRGIRGRVHGSTFHYSGKAILAYLWTALSLGIAKPWADMHLLGYKLQNSSFGQRGVGFRISTVGLWKPYLLFWFSIPAYAVAAGLIAYFLDDNLITQTQQVSGTTVKISAKSEDPLVVSLTFLLLLVPAYFYLNYRATFWRTVAANAQFGQAKPAFDADARDFFKLVAINYLITVISLGVLIPLTWLRKGSFLARHLVLVGNPGTDGLVQAEFDETSTGEGLLGDFDIA